VKTITITTEAESKEHGLPIGTWTLRESREVPIVSTPDGPVLTKEEALGVVAGLLKAFPEVQPAVCALFDWERGGRTKALGWTPEEWLRILEDPSHPLFGAADRLSFEMSGRLSEASRKAGGAA